MIRRRDMRGQALTEYLVVGLALAIAFFLVPVENGRTLSQITSDMVRLFFQNLTYFISLP
jgi:hypothetical protein